MIFVRSLVMLMSCLAMPAIFVPVRAEAPHTFDGKHDISVINLTVAYLVPSDRQALPDWRERVDYYMDRIGRFHDRESSGVSKLNIQVHPEPLGSGKSAQELRGDEPNATFFNSVNEAAGLLKWNQEKAEGFPILLVLSEINWRELDDFTRLRQVDGKPTLDGNVASDGRHFPGAESGGARAIYDPEKGIGVGLVSADGWRVPYSGSDCVVYHEGLGHAIGLPHPEPADESVMCFGQYHFWINQTWVTPSQKLALGWPAHQGPVPLDFASSTDLFTAFTALQSPIVPQPGEAVSLKLTWPKDAKVSAIQVRIQTDLKGPWLTLPSQAGLEPPAELALGTFDRVTPVSYCVNVMLENGQKVELRGYFQVKAKAP